MKNSRLLALAAIVALAASCTQTQRTNAKDAAIDCVHQDLGQTVPQIGLSIVMYVASIIFEGPSDWQSKLASVGATFGPEALACAEKIAEQMFRPAPSDAGSGSGSGLSTGEIVETPHDRAVKALSGKTFK